MTVFKIETNFGNVHISKHVVGRIVAEAIESFDGRVMLSNSRGKILSQSKKTGSMDKTEYLEYSFEDERLVIKVNVVIRFGNSISKIANQLSERIQAELYRHLELEASYIGISITGVLSKQLARRNILINFYK
ncbi:MAG: Asp23/Gls24 family envelope stress response protein [Anaerovoracaceae bacterium]